MRGPSSFLAREDIARNPLDADGRLAAEDMAARARDEDDPTAAVLESLLFEIDRLRLEICELTYTAAAGSSTPIRARKSPSTIADERGWGYIFP